jgi:Asp-tRNA(Asn)/Glu-tRNA(Gln) amidotransferase C subunit
MADDVHVSRDAVRSVARLANLDLPNDRLDQLVTTLSAYLKHLDRLREIDIRDSEPPAITFESEARS